MVCPACGWEASAVYRCPRCSVVYKRSPEKVRRPAAPSSSRPPVPAPRTSALRTVLYIVAGVAVVTGCLVLAVMGFIRQSEPYRMVATLIRGSEAIRTVVGSEPRLGYWVSGSVETTSTGGGTARLVIPVHGPAGSTKVQAALRRRAQRWTIVNAVYLERDGSVKRLTAATDAASGQEPSPGTPLEKADALYRQGDFPAALAVYDQILAQDHSRSEAHYGHGATAWKLGQEERALADLKECIRLDPSRAEAYRLFDQILSRRQAWDEIIDAWSLLIRVEPGNAQAYVERGGAYYHKRDLAAARADAEKACALGSGQGCDIVARLTGR